MAELFQRDRSVIGKHVRNIFKEGELQKESVWAKFAYTAADGKVYDVDYYNLDVIISVGYRVKSKRGTQFRIWATGILAVLSSLLMAFAPGLFLICAAVSAVFRLLSGECAVQQHFHTGHAPAEGTCGHRSTSRPEFPFPARAAGPVRAAGMGQCRRPARLPAGGKTHRCRCVHLCPLLSDQDVPAAAARGAGLAHRVAFSSLAAGRCGLRGRYRDRPTGTSPHPAAVLHGVCPAGRRRGLHGAAFWA